MPKENDDRPPMVVAMYWAQQITSISIEMALPAGLGLYLDQRWGTGPWLVAAGALLGFAGALWHLMTIVKRGGSGTSEPPRGKSSR